MKRRALLALFGSGLAGVAGCSEPQSRDAGIELTVFNQADVSYTIEIEFLENSSPRGEARVYDTTLDIEAGGRDTRETGVESRRYLIRYHVYEDDSRLTDEDHIHYIPSENGSDSLTFDIERTGELTRR